MDMNSTAGNPWAVGVQGEWYRGNLHCHTTNSDGRLSPQATVDWFAGAGYQFMALTDHNTVTDPATLDARGMCLVTSAEVTAGGGELGVSYHLITVGLRPDAALPPVTTAAAQTIAELHAQGAGAPPAIFVAHPHWSGLTVGDIAALAQDQIAGIEVYNGGSVLDSHKGEATVHWDEGLARGARWWGIAVDDTHWHTLDRGLGWVMVRAASHTAAAITEALRLGHFYASTGPQIRNLSLAPEGDTWRLEVETSPCAAIYALQYGGRNQFVADGDAIAQGKTGATITRASFLLKGPDSSTTSRVQRYVRVQCTDWQRNTAWSNPLFLQL